MLKYDWANVEIHRGDSSRGLPWNNGQFGSNTSYTMSRTNYVAAMDAHPRAGYAFCQGIGLRDGRETGIVEWARVEGPYGAFSYVNIPNRRQIWIAGGIGITPFVSMARDLSESEHRIDFYYSMRSIRQGYLLAEFLHIEQRLSNFNVIPYPEDESGFLTADVIEERSGGLEDKDIMICGPPPMIDALRSQFYAKGVPKGRVHYEKFGFAPKRKGRGS